MRSISESKQMGKLTEERLTNIIASLPARFRDVDIDKCADFIRSWAYGPREKKGLYLWGPVGTGKTYAAFAIYVLSRVNMNSTLIGNSTMILQDIKDDFTYQAKDPYYRSKFDKWILHDEVLIIDDIGSEKPTEWVLETFYTLINTRYEKDLPTIFTSNYSLDELAERLGDRIASRIAELCEVKKLDGHDRRLAK